MSRRRNRPTGRVIWIAKDPTGLWAFNHAPKTKEVECAECGGKTVEFIGTDGEDCSEICESVKDVLRLPVMKNGDLIRYELTR